MPQWWDSFLPFFDIQFIHVEHLHIVTSGPNLVELPRALVVSLLQWLINPGAKNGGKKTFPKPRRGKIEHPTKKVREDKTSSQKGWGRIKHGQKRWRKHQNQKKERIISTLKMQCPGCWDVQCKWPAALKATWMRVYRIEVVKKLRLRVFVKKDKS